MALFVYGIAEEDMPESQQVPSSQQAASQRSPPPRKRPRTRATFPLPSELSADHNTRVSLSNHPSRPSNPLHPPLSLHFWSDSDAENDAAASIRMFKTKLETCDNAQVQLPLDFDYPSPPPSSQGSLDAANEKSQGGDENAQHGPNEPSQGVVLSAPSNNLIRLPAVTESFAPPAASQDSACFSFSKQNIQTVETDAHGSISEPARATKDEKDEEENEHASRLRQRYYTRTFEYVLNEVTKRFSQILRREDIDLVKCMRHGISSNALALFARLYRRKVGWHRVQELQNSYAPEIDVEKAVAELCQQGLLSSSHYAMKSGQGERIGSLIAKGVIESLRSAELKSVCNSLPDGGSLKKLGRRQLLPVLQRRLVEEPRGRQGRKRLRQMTLTGVSPQESLMKAVLKTAGHCVSMPEYVLISLERIHFLFFLDDGHDSPNVILADTGKVKFAEYECKPKRGVFTCAAAYEEFEDAVKLENELNTALEEKDYVSGAHIGAVAELEMKEYLDGGDGLRGGLEHGFFRRYTAGWVYARVVWHSVEAVEKLGEYEDAVRKLEMLLGCGLMSSRRGKWLNRITINMFKHLGLIERPLRIIMEALQGKSWNELEFGDQMDLAKRGLAIYRKQGSDGNEDVKQVLENAASVGKTKIHVRKIYGKSLQVWNRERARQGMREKKELWMSFCDEDSKDSINKLEAKEGSIMGKASFESAETSGEKVSVEEYCMQWYFGKEGWNGVHDEGGSVRFLFGLLMWESALFATVDDVFQTPYQDRPLDLCTEVFYQSRRAGIEARLAEIEAMSAEQLEETVVSLYAKHENVRAVGCRWAEYSAEMLGHIGAGLGGVVLAHCFRLLARNFSYWASGLPDLTLWKQDDGSEARRTMLVEVKSARDELSEKQRAWLIQLGAKGAHCEVCKVVEKKPAETR